jgi:hypothetical protein
MGFSTVRFKGRLSNKTALTVTFTLPEARENAGVASGRDQCQNSSSV